MSFFRISENIFSVGTLNPNLRTFDIVMRTDYGTSYNSYVVRGKEKTALIDVNHELFFGKYLENIGKVCDVRKISYIIINHCEPDHAGALEKLIKYCPDAEILVSETGARYLREITNSDRLPVRAVHDGEKICLGGKTLEFISAPMLHWPDSMFTHCEEDGILFSCDFFGAHYCEPYMIDTSITYEKSYCEAFAEYYRALFGPFAKYVRKGLDRLDGLYLNTICPGHGPVLTRGAKLEYAVERYRLWSTEINTGIEIPVFYCSAYGNTGRLAHAVRDGIKAVLPECSSECYDITMHSPGFLSEKINRCTAFAVGSPTINRDTVPVMWNLLANVDAINSRGKGAVVFGSYGWSGEAVTNLVSRLKCLKINVIEELRVPFVPCEADLDAARSTGMKIAHCTLYSNEERT